MEGSRPVSPAPEGIESNSWLAQCQDWLLYFNIYFLRTRTFTDIIRTQYKINKLVDILSCNPYNHSGCAVSVMPRTPLWLHSVTMSHESCLTWNIFSISPWFSCQGTFADHVRFCFCFCFFLEYSSWLDSGDSLWEDRSWLQFTSCQLWARVSWLRCYLPGSPLKCHFFSVRGNCLRQRKYTRSHPSSTHCPNTLDVSWLN
jgi:hypothetical protein